MIYFHLTTSNSIKNIASLLPSYQAIKSMVNLAYRKLDINSIVKLLATSVTITYAN